MVDVHILSDLRATQAQHVREGDCVRVFTGAKGTEYAIITGIHAVLRTGVYAPMTQNGE